MRSKNDQHGPGVYRSRRLPRSAEAKQRRRRDLFGAGAGGDDMSALFESVDCEQGALPAKGEALGCFWTAEPADYRDATLGVPGVWAQLCVRYARTASVAAEHGTVARDDLPG